MADTDHHYPWTDAARWTPDLEHDHHPTPPPRALTPLIHPYFAGAAVRAAADFNAAMQRLSASLSQTMHANLAGLRRLAALLAPNRYDAHHPRPLPINGHAYHQRRRARQRRNR